MIKLKKEVVCNINSNQKELYVVQPTRFLLKPGECKLVSRIFHHCSFSYFVVRCKTSVVNNLLDTALPTKYVFIAFY